MKTTDPNELPAELKGKRQLGAKDSFNFSCHRGLPCYTKCCGDINILLTPVDVLLMSRRLGISTSNFLDKYTLTPITKALHLPVLLLKMSEENDRRCQLLGPEGCSVYSSRPWACRMYPLGMAIPPARAGVMPEPIYFLLEDDFCKGHGVGMTFTPDQWRQDQGLPEREHLEEGFREIVSHPWFIGGRQLDPKRIEMFHMACYDLDRFRRFILESTFLSRFDLEAGLAEQLRTDDEALLKFGYRWLRMVLFGEPTLKVRQNGPTHGR